MDIALSAEGEGLWTVEDVARFLKLRPYTIRLWVRVGRLPAIVTGRIIRFAPQEIRSWVKRHAR